jgi:hypothetical protein
MRRGSHLVAEGDEVSTGQPLGLVGLSGQTSFPHVHFDVRHDEQPVDPFVGDVDGETVCDQELVPLWQQSVQAQLDQEAPFLTNIGIAPASPKHDDIRKGWHRAPVLSTASPALVLWIDGYWFQERDQLDFRLDGPNGHQIVKRTFEVKSPRQSWFSFAGAPRPAAGWPPGIYRGEVAVKRPGRALHAILRHEVELR